MNLKHTVLVRQYTEGDKGMGFKTTGGERSQTALNIGAVAIINIALALTAFIKDLSFAAYAGTSEQADAFVLAFFVPDMIGNNIFAASLAVTMVPAFATLYSKYGYRELAKLLKNTVISTLCLMTVLTVLMYFFIPHIVSILGPGLDNETKSMAEGLLAIMLPTVAVFPLVTIGSSVHHTLNSFRKPAVAPLVFNAVFLSGVAAMFIFGIPLTRGVYYIALFVAGGVLLMTCVVWPYILSKRSISMQLLGRPVFYNDELMVSSMGRVIKTFVPYTVILILIQGTLYVEKYLASQLEQGSIAALNYAFRLSQFPIWVFVAALGTVYLPQMSRFSGENNHRGLKNIAGKSVIQCFLLTLPVAAALFFLRIPIITVLFMRGAFGMSSVIKTSFVLEGYSFALIGQALVFICLRIYLALHNTRIPLYSFLTGFLITLSVNLLLIDTLGLRAIGYAAAAGSMVNSAILLVCLLRKYRYNPAKTAARFALVLLSAVPMVLIFIAGSYLMQRVHGGFAIRAGLLALVLASGIAVYGLCVKRCSLLKNAI